jgi:hypothetical protein
MSATLSGDLIPLIGQDVYVATNGAGGLAVTGTLTRVGNDYILVSFTQNDALFELRIFFANIIYVHKN